MLNTALRTSLRDYDSIVGYVYKIEGVDSEHLEPLGSIKFKCIRQDRQE